jgi:geranylgeranyl pyrophosphate synthase
MGKPAGSDLKAGKRTALVVDALNDRRAQGLLEGVLGRDDTADGAIREAIDAIASCGALTRVEARIDALVHECRAALDGVALTPQGRSLLGEAIIALTERQA